MIPLNPDDLETGEKFFSLLIQVGKWLGGTFVAAWIASKWIIKAGEQKRRYAELSEDVEALKERNTLMLTRLEHDDLQRVCQSHIERTIDAKIHNAVIEMRDQMDVMNANLCRIMGKLDVAPVDPGRKRRRSDDGLGE